MKTTLIFMCLFFSVAISAADAEPYFGLGPSFTLINLKNSDPPAYPQGASGLGTYVGYRYGDVAVEIGYGTSTVIGDASSQTDNLHLDKLTADGIFYIPLMSRDPHEALSSMNILLTGGISDTNYGGSSDDSGTSDPTLFNGNEFDWRIGVGVSFVIYGPVEFRVIGRYEQSWPRESAQGDKWIFCLTAARIAA